MTDWPITLPSRLNRSDYQDEFESTSVATQMDSGRVKRRRRFSSGTRPINGSMVMTSAQVEILDEFYHDTVKQVEPFNFTHPRTGDACVVVFIAAPKPVYWAPDMYKVNINLEVQP